jgi:chorismate mutase
MTNEKKDLAVAGNKDAQYEWMVEEVNEFYEAIHLNDPEEIRDEAMGLIRTVQQFAGSECVVELWEKVRKDVAVVFPSWAVFDATFNKWHAKKLAKKQALDVVVDDLVRVSGIQW